MAWLSSVIRAYLAAGWVSNIDKARITPLPRGRGTNTPWRSTNLCNTPADICPILQSWLHNSEGVPTAIHKEADGSLDLQDIDVWLWLKKLAPWSKLVSLNKSRLIDLFSIPQQWESLINYYEINQLTGDSLQNSICGSFLVNGCKALETPIKELAQWLAANTSLTFNHAW